jgi:predicted O-linked N-acetylglucosamine transferase (SPINDLY family)
MLSGATLSQNRKQRRTARPGNGSPDSALQNLLNTALQHHQAGRLAEAESIYRQILALDPRHADSLHLLGVLAHQVGRPDVAAGLIGQAIAVRGDDSLYHNNLANALRDQGRPDEAMASYRCALELKPDFADALINLGVILKSQGNPDEATTCYQRALKLRPESAETHNNLANVLQAQGRFDDAVAGYRRAIALKPGYAEAHYNLGNAFEAKGKPDDAMACYERAIALNPSYAEAYGHLGRALQNQGRFGEAAVLYKQALALTPESTELLVNLGTVLAIQDQFDEAMLLFEKAIALNPTSVEALNCLGSMYSVQGKFEDAVPCYRRALAVEPESETTYNNFLLMMVYAASVSPEELADTAREFGRNIADPLRRQRPFARNADPDRKLRIGYISPDFRNHAVNYFFEFLLKRQDRQHFEAFAYSNTFREDHVTARLRQAFDHWRDIRFLDDEKAADLIESDAIDILVDLAGHTGSNRLLVFARKPAPVQVTWLGWPTTTGMKAIDYRITDQYAEPPGMTEHLNVEILWRLPGIFCCYQPYENSPAITGRSPFEDNGHITFGCSNNFMKVTDLVLETWARILAQVPGSRLLLEIRNLESPRLRARIEERLLHAGLPLDRLLLEPRKSANQFVLYNRFDIALDPFPCNGGTTSFDTLWMGVPLVTLAGKHFVSRMGVTILTNAGMPELIARNIDEYVKLATDLAQDRNRLRNLRHNLRDRVAASPLMNQAAFAHNIEAAYREMWQKWCHES